MKIVHVIDAVFPVPGYGGTERVAYWLGKAQAELGHEVTYLCRPGSSLDFARCLPAPSGYDDLSPHIPKGTDFVQLYGTPQFKLNYPYLVNIGGNGRAGERFDPNTVFVSRDHARRHGWEFFVHNGIDISEYPLSRSREDYILFLAKASWAVKNLKGAIRITREAKQKLYVAGGKAACWHRHVRSFGSVGGQEKLELLQKASALLFPIIWPEPFGLAVVEALACGTPVVATPRGAMPEILTKDCGILADSHEALVAALGKVGSLDPEACRARVAQEFTHIQMAKRYLEYYTRVQSQGRLGPGQPAAPANADPQERILYAGY